MNLIRNLLSGKITFAIRVGGHIKKIHAWTIRQAIMLLFARESPRSSQPSDSCPLLIPRPLRTKKYLLNIQNTSPLQESFGRGIFGRQPKSRNLKNIASRFTGILWLLLVHDLFLTRDARHPEAWHPLRMRPPPSCQILTFQCEGGCTLSPFLSLFLRQEHIEDASHGKKWDFVTDRSSRRMQKIAGVRNIIPDSPRFFPRFISTWDTTAILLSLHRALDYRWNM